MTGAGLTDAISKRLGRTLDSLAKRKLITPYFERALVRADWPEEYAIRVFNKERHWDGYFHPSTHAPMDPLQLYYEFHPDYETEKRKSDPIREMTFQIGNAFHSLVQSMFVHLGFVEESEIEVSFINERRWVSGTLDVRKFTLPDGESFPVEIKSAAYLPRKPYDNHIQQLNIYMDLGCEEPQEKGILFYIEKTPPHRLEEFIVERDESILTPIYRKFDRVREAIDMDDPSGLRNCCMPDTKQHRACPARNVCRIGPPKPSGV